MKNVLFLFLLVPVLGFSQKEEATTVVDSLYKEDQFYVGVGYNVVRQRPANFSQNGFSLGFNLGFIKDMPLNERRNVAIGIGLGYATNSFNQNLLISEGQNGAYNYTILTDGNSYNKNKFSNHLIELPIEFRWRTSTPTDYAFWRIYAGFKVGYVFHNAVKYRGDLGSYKLVNISDFNNFQYGLTLSVGYNTWNLHVNYSLNPIFNSNASLYGEPVDLSSIKLGLMFYIL